MRAADIVFALATALPLSAAGFAASAALERSGVSAAVLERVWSLAYWLGPAASVLALIDDALPRRASIQIEVVLRATPLAGLAQAARALAQAPRWHWPEGFALVLGAVALGAAFRLAQLARAWLTLKALRQDATDAPTETVRAIRAAGLKPSVPVRLSAEASTPVAVGLFKPEVLLPERFAAPEGALLAALVCRHEAQHIRRRDNLRLLLEQLAGALLWFDPLRGALHRRLLAAREERCDAAALAGCGPAERTLYAKTLLDELTQPSWPALAVSLVGVGRSHAMTRVSAIIDPQPARRRPALTLGLCTALALTGGGAALAASQADPPALMRTASAEVAALPLAAPTRFKVVDAATHAAAPNDIAYAVQIATGPPQAPTDAGGAVEGRVVQRIEIEGLHRWPKSMISSMLSTMYPRITLGGVVTPADVNLAQIGLVNTGLFTDVAVSIEHDDSVQPGGAALKVVVAEDPDFLSRGRSLWPAADEGGPIDITADRLEDGNEAGALRYVGNVVLTGGLKPMFEQARVLFDGRPAPQNFAPARGLTAAAVELKFAIDAEGRRGKVEAVNIQGLIYAE